MCLPAIFRCLPLILTVSALAPSPISAQTWETLLPAIAGTSQPLLIETRPGGYRVLNAETSFVNGVESSIRIVDLFEITGAIENQVSTPPTASFRTLNQALPANDGGYVAAGDVSTPSGLFSYLEKFNALGIVVWTKMYDQEFQFIRMFAAPDNNGYVLLARSASSSESYLLAVDNTGNVQWQQFVTLPNPSLLSDLAIRPSGEILVVGAESSPDGQRAALWTFDPAGTLTATQTFDRSLYGDQFTCLQLLPGGALALGGASFTLSNRQEAWILKLDSAGALAWSRTFGAWNNDQMSDLIVLSDGSVAGTGNLGAFWPGSSLYIAQLKAADGAVIAERSYGGVDTSASGYWLIEGPGHCLVAFGTKGAAGYVVKDEFPTVSVPSPGAGDLHCTVLPNPASDRVELRLQHARLRRGVLKIFDAQGVLVRESTWRGTTAIVERGLLSAGTYHFMLLADRGAVATGSFVFR